MGEMINSAKMIRYRSSLFAGIVFLVCAVFLPAIGIFGEERSHPSLIDPAITKCAVCHAAVPPTHPEIAAVQSCLECHTLIGKSGKTFVVVDSNRKAPGVDQPSAKTESANARTELEGGESGDPQHATVGGDRHISDVVTAAPTTGSAEQKPSSKVQSSAGAERGTTQTASSIEGGMREFNRGNFESAFDAWSAILANHPDHFTLQVEVDNYFISAQSTMARYGEHSLYVLKKDDLFVVYSGLFATLAEATEALKSLPEPLRRGGAFPLAVRQVVLYQ